MSALTEQLGAAQSGQDTQPAEGNSAPDATTSTESKPFHSFIGDDGKFSEGAWDNFPVLDGEDPEVFKRIGRKTTDIPSLARNYANLERLLSKEKIPLPTDNDGEEVWEHVYNALGRPEDGKYQVPEGIGIDETTAGAVGQILHKAGISQRQANKIFGELGGVLEQSQAAQADASKQALESTISDLEQQVGPRTGRAYQETLQKADLVAEHLGFDDPTLFQQKGFALKLASLHDRLMDGAGIKGAENSRITQIQSIDAEIKAIQSDPNHRLYSAYRSGDAKAHAYVQGLYDKKYQE